MRIKKVILVLAFIFFINVFFIPSIVFASTGEIQETLNVEAVFVDGKMLQIDVSNINTGQKQKLELRLKDYTMDSEYVSIQAIDLDGNKSNIVQIKNPYYVSVNQEKNSNTQNDNTKNTNESAIPDGKVPFTPKGTGEVMDNAKDGDGKEFFTIKTQNDNVFHLIIDRQRNEDNVYLLNAVTEADLMELAEKSGNPISVIPTPSPDEPIQVPTPELEEVKQNIGSFVLLGFVTILIAGIGYYFKVYKPKQENFDVESNSDEENDKDYEYENENENENKDEDEDEALDKEELDKEE